MLCVLYTEALEMSDQTLTSAFTTLRQKIHSFATRFFPSEEDADDALQDAFCRLWPKRDDIKTLSQAEALAKVTVKNIAIDTCRKRNAHPISELSENIDISDEDDTCSKNEKFDLVKQIIDNELTESQRTILRLRDFEEKPFAEIAKALGIEETAVRAQLSRARKKIRECYYKLSSDERR